MSSQRIRTIKPDFWTDEKIVELPFEARLLFIGLWNLADDEGFFWDEPGRIKFQLFPADDVDVSYLFGLLLKQDFLEHYETDEGKGFFRLRNFVKHQTISHARQSKFRQLKGFPHNHINDDPAGRNSKPPATSGRNRKPLPPSGTSSLEGEGEGEMEGERNRTNSSVAVKETDSSPYGDSRAFTKPRERTSPPEFDTEDLQILKTLCEDLDAKDLLDVDWWRRILQLTDGTQVFVDNALRKYLAHQETLPVSRKHKNRKRGFMTWVKTDIGREAWRKSNAGR